jgi:hypothetical protein
VVPALQPTRRDVLAVRPLQGLCPNSHLSGTGTLTATYAGDATFRPSTSPSVTHTVLGQVRAYLPVIVR